MIDYTDCNTTATTSFTAIPESKVSTSFKSSNTVARPQWRRTLNTTHPPHSVEIPNTPVCTLQFSIPNDIGPPVYLYYRLTNFYQNHRRYVKSLDTDQLKGKALSNDTIGTSSCNPLKLDHNGKAYYPCGLIANSIFNDTLNSPVAVSTSGGQESQQYRMTNEGIAWSSDSSMYKKTHYTNSQVSPPPNWHNRYPNGYTDENPIPDLSQYEEFQVWMRTAGLPTFSKLALRNDNETMTAGTYQMDIYDCKSTLLQAHISSDRFSLPCHGVFRDQKHPSLNEVRRWRKEQLLRHCLCRCGWSMHCAWSCLHHCPPD